MPSETFTHSAVAPATVGAVWAEFDKPSTWENIGGIDRVVDPVIDSEGRLQAFSFDSVVAGKAYRGTATSAGRDEGSMISWNIENSEISGRIQVEVVALDAGAQIDVSLTMASKGMLSSMFFGVISKTVGEGLPRSVEEFAAGFG